MWLFSWFCPSVGCMPLFMNCPNFSLLCGAVLALLMNYPNITLVCGAICTFSWIVPIILCVNIHTFSWSVPISPCYTGLYKPVPITVCHVGTTCLFSWFLPTTLFYVVLHVSFLEEFQLLFVMWGCMSLFMNFPNYSLPESSSNIIYMALVRLTLWQAFFYMKTSCIWLLKVFKNMLVSPWNNYSASD